MISFTYFQELPTQFYGLFMGAVVLFFFIEPSVRKRFPYTEANLTVLLMYIFFSHFSVMASHEYQRYAFWLYFFAVFSGGLSFGLVGSVGTTFFITILYFLSSVGAAPEFELFTPANLTLLIPLYAFAIILGFLVEQKMRQERETFQKIAQVTTLKRLRNVSNIEGRADPGVFLQEIFQQMVEVLRPVAAAMARLETDGFSISHSLNVPADDPLVAWMRSGELTGEVRVLRRRRDIPSDYHSIMIVPMRVRDISVSIVLADRREEIWFKDEDLEIARAMRDYSLLLMENRLIHDDIRQTRDFLDRVLSASQAAVIAVDGGGRIRMVNRNALLLTGHISADGLIEKRLCSDVYLFPSRQRDPILRCLDLGDEVRIAEGTLLRGDHSQIPIQYATTRFVHGDGTTWVLFTALDISELQRLRAEIARKEHLGIYRRLMAEFAHEIKNPLGGIEGFASLLKKELEKDARLAKMADRVIEGVSSISGTINQFLELSLERQPQKERKFSVREVAQKAGAEVSFLADSRGVGVAIESPGISLSGSPEHFQRALVNLLKNAIEACRMGEGRVRLTASEQKGEIQVQVSDNGIGFHEEPSRIFDPFFTTKEKGLGLGLPIVQKIIEEEFSGKLQVESAPGGGATFRIVLPAA
ncbi:GHKL domain-containing protein [bacterium]|nr:GHKL domain-containing protein [bacterium]